MSKALKNLPLQMTLITALMLSVAGTAPALAAGSSGGGSASAPVQSRPTSPEQEAEANYLKGIKHKERAWKLEQKALAATKEKRKARDLKRAAKEYFKAQELFAEVLRTFPENYKAANELGYVLRKQGNYEQAVGAYNYALQLHPDFLEAVEYRGEAFIALGFYDEAREAYMRLFRENTELAEQLMAKMQTWAAEQENPGAKARNFSEWIESRQNVSAFGELTKSQSSGW